jgi:DNA replication protein DnaC
MTNTSIEVIQELEALGLHAFAARFKTAVEEHPELQAALVALVLDMARAETSHRKERRVDRCIQAAGFIQIQTVDAFDFDYNASTRKIRKTYLHLIEANVVEKDIGAIFVGGSGLGKTHLARALGYRMCQRGERVLFTTCSDMLNKLVASEATKSLIPAIKKYESPGLLLIDELGYLTLGQSEADLFFHVVSRRHDRKKPTVVTTNRSFGEWNQVFKNDSTAHAIVDRLTEKAEIFYLQGKSYRETHRAKRSLPPPEK